MRMNSEKFLKDIERLKLEHHAQLEERQVHMEKTLAKLQKQSQSEIFVK